jgi:hypothetical protein
MNAEKTGFDDLIKSEISLPLAAGDEMRGSIFAF